MKTLLKSSILFIALIVQGCGDDATNDRTYEYGVLKSDPPMPPLIYEWSHPDCPFTANFPGKPEVEEFIDENGVGEIIVQYTGNTYGYQISCDLNRIKTGVMLDNELLDYYVKQIAVSANTANFKAVKIESSIFKNLPNVVFHFVDKINTNRNIFENALIFHQTTTLLTSSILYQNDLIKDSNGAEFFETVKLK